MKIQNTETDARHPWPEGCFVQGGSAGVVFTKTGSYTTAFVEAFPDTFIRGEGVTIEEAEDHCWAQYQEIAGCPGHEWEARNYQNGGGICKHCGAFGSRVFTPEDLGLSCKTCGVPTFWSRQGDDFFCPDHATDRDTEWLRKHGELRTGSRIGDILAAIKCPNNHAENCCADCDTHTMPHMGCILR